MGFFPKIEFLRTLMYFLSLHLQTEEELRIKEERVAAYKAKKETKSKFFFFFWNITPHVWFRSL